jgi:hypothetical protein
MRREVFRDFGVIILDYLKLNSVETKGHKIEAENNRVK